MVKIEPIKTQAYGWFKPTPKGQGLIAKCQPIKDYAPTDRLQVDTFQRKEPVFKGGINEPKPGV